MARPLVATSKKRRASVEVYSRSPTCSKLHILGLRLGSLGLTRATPPFNIPVPIPSLFSGWAVAESLLKLRNFCRKCIQVDRS